jgi:hypothetical protein
MNSDLLAGDHEKRILDILKYHRINHLAVYPDIPPHKIEIARKKFNFPDVETPLALYDSTSFGSGNHGMAFGTSGIYWNNDALSEEPGIGFISYEDLTKSDIKRRHTFQVELSYGSIEKLILAYIGEQSKPAKDLERLLYLIKYGITTFSNAPVEELREKVEMMNPSHKNDRVVVDILIKILAWGIAAVLMTYIIWKFVLPTVLK